MEVLRTAILDMLRRKQEESFPSSEVVQQMFPEDWEQFLEEVNTVAMELYHEGLLQVIESKQPVRLDSSLVNTLIISSPNKLK